MSAVRLPQGYVPNPGTEFSKLQIYSPMPKKVQWISFSLPTGAPKKPRQECGNCPGAVGYLESRSKGEDAGGTVLAPSHHG